MKEGERIVGQTVSEAVQPYSPEYRVQRNGAGQLAELGRLGGGGTLTEPSQVFERPQQARLVPQPLWGHCIWLAAVLLLLDVAVRRLEWGRANRSRAPRQDVAPIRLPRRKRTSTTPRVRQTQQRNEDPPEDDDDPPQGPTPPPAQEVAPESYAGRLLAARNRANRRFEDEDQ